MGHAEDEVKKYIRNNLTRFYNIRVNQLLDYLPCLTAADREEITAREDNKGNIAVVHKLFEHLRCRTGWVKQLIHALEENNSDLAGDIRQVYESAQVPLRRSPLPPSADPPAANVSQPEVRAPSSDYPPLSPPHNQSTPSRAQLPPCANALTPAPSTSLQDVVDYGSPVQETKLASQSSETPIEAKALGNDVNPKISTPEQRNTNAAESNASLVLHHDKPTHIPAASPESSVQHQLHLGEASGEEMQSTEPVSSNTNKGNLVRNWDGVQQRPVCVKNGYFGNMNRSLDSGLSPASTGPERTASSGLTAFRNQPEETSYVSSDISPLAPRGQDGMQAEERMIQASLGYQQEDLLCDTTDNKPFLPQKHFDEEQKGAPGQKDSSSNTNTVHLHQKGDNRHSKQVNSRTLDFREMPSTAIQTGNASASFQRRGETVPPSIPSATETANSFEQDSSSSGSDDASHDHSLYREATPGVGQLSKDCLANSSGNAVGLETRGSFVAEPPPAAPLLGRSPSKSGQLPQRSSRQEHVSQVPNTVPVARSEFPLSDFARSSSINVIPPSSPTVVSSSWSDGYSEDLKHPIQEREPWGTDVLTTPELRPKNMPGGAFPRATRVMDPATNSGEQRNKAKGHARDIYVFNSNPEEEDTALFKPGVLVSGNMAEWASDQQLNNKGMEYSGTSERFFMSPLSDPLQLSNSTQNSNPEEMRIPPVEGISSRRNVTMGTSIASLQNDNHSDEGSLRTHTVHIEESSSVDLSGAPGITGLAFGNASQSPGDFSDSVSGDQLIKNAGSRPVCSDGQRNSPQNEDIANPAGWWHMSDSTALTIGFALTSLVAVSFLLFRQLKK